MEAPQGIPDMSLGQLENLMGSYRSLTQEIRAVVGNGEGATDCEGIAEKRAGVRLRGALTKFLDDFPYKEQLPECIRCTKDKYLFAQTNKVYRVSIDSDLNTDGNFIPENPRFRGAEMTSHLIEQNERLGTPLQGLLLSTAHPRLSEPEATVPDGKPYQRFETLQNEDVELIIAALQQKLSSEDTSALFAEFQQNAANIRAQQHEEQKELEDTYAVLLKTKFAEWVTALERILRVPLPDKIPLHTDKDLDDELSIKGLGKSVARSLGKKHEDKQILQLYFHTNDIKMELVPVEKRTLGSWSEVESQKREATSREFIERRQYVKSVLFNMFPEKTRVKLRYP